MEFYSKVSPRNSKSFLFKIIWQISFSCQHAVGVVLIGGGFSCFSVSVVNYISQFKHYIEMEKIFVYCSCKTLFEIEGSLLCNAFFTSDAVRNYNLRSWRHFDIVSKYHIGLKTLLLQGLSETEFYGDLVYKFRKIIGKNDFPYHFKKKVVRYKKIGYNMNV